MARVTTPREHDLSHGPRLSSMTPVEARAILGVRFAKSDLDRMDDLLALSRAGRLTEAERTEMQSYLTMGNLLSLLHSKARVSLAARPATRQRKPA